MTKHQASLSIDRIVVVMRAQRPVSVPHFLGSALRGAFGRSLRKQVCVTRQPSCEGCQVRRLCAYGTVFSPGPLDDAIHPSFKNAPPNYVVVPPKLGATVVRKDEHLEWSLILFGPGLQYRQEIEATLDEAVSHELIRPHEFVIQQLEVSRINKYFHPTGLDSATASPLRSRLVVNFETPFRAQVLGKPIRHPQDMSSYRLLSAVDRRIQQVWPYVTTTSGPPPPVVSQLDQLSCDFRNLDWHDLHRKSQNHAQRQPMGGLLGSATVEGPSGLMDELLGRLEFVKELQIGKEAAMGLGRYNVSSERVTS